MADNWPSISKTNSLTNSKKKYGAWGSGTSVQSKAHKSQKSKFKESASAQDPWNSKKHRNEAELNPVNNSVQKTNKSCWNTVQNDSWNAVHNDTSGYSNFPKSKDDDFFSSVWDFPIDSKQERSGTAVNVWEERKRKQEEIKAMEPASETEEEAMVRRALELSKMDAEKDIEKQKKLSREYELQMQFLETHPELLNEFCVSNDVSDDAAVYCDKTVPEEVTVLSKSPSNCFDYDQNIKIEKDSGRKVYEKNKPISFPSVKPKLGKIIDSFGGWGIKETSRNTNEIYDSEFCDNKCDKDNFSKKNDSVASSTKLAKSKLKAKQFNIESETEDKTCFNFDENYLSDSYESDKIPKKKSSKLDSPDNSEKLKGSEPMFQSSKVCDSESAVVENRKKNSSYSNFDALEFSNQSVTENFLEFDEFVEVLENDSVDDISKDFSSLTVNNEILEFDEFAEVLENDPDDAIQTKNAAKEDICNETRNSAVFNNYSFQTVNANDHESLERQFSCSIKNEYNENDAVNVNSTNKLLKDEFNSFNAHNVNSNFTYSSVSLSSDASISASNSTESFNQNCETSSNVGFSKLQSSYVPDPKLHENEHLQLPFAESPLANIQENTNPVLSSLPPGFGGPNSPVPPASMMPSFPLVQPMDSSFIASYANLNPIMQQMLLISNPFFVKQLQALDFHYRTMGVPYTGLPVPSMQMPCFNYGNAFQSFQSPNMLNAQSHLNSSSASTIEKNPQMPVLGGADKVPQRTSSFGAPGFDSSYMHCNEPLDPFQEAEVNSFLDRYCGNDLDEDEPVIPPPRPHSLEDNVSVIPPPRPHSLEENVPIIPPPRPPLLNQINSQSKKFDNPTNLASSYAGNIRDNDPFQLSSVETNLAHGKHTDVKTNIKSFDVSSCNVKPAVKKLEMESSGWNDPEDDFHVPRNWKTNFDDSIDGWGNNTSAALIKSVSKSASKNSTTRQPSSQPYVGRCKKY